VPASSSYIDGIETCTFEMSMVQARSRNDNIDTKFWRCELCTTRSEDSSVAFVR